MKWASQRNGFTIVELLIVVVVIAILAAISIVSYNGITKRADESRRASDFSQYQKRIESAKVTSGTETYPSDINAVGIKQPQKGILTYGTTYGGKNYCLDVSEDYGDTAYMITQDNPQPVPGFCGTMNGLVAWWPMNGSTRDATSNGNDGQGTGLVDAQGAQGVARTAYAFNGSSSQMLCGTDLLLRPTDAVTVTAWVYIVGAPASVAGIISNGAQGYTLGVLSTQGLRWSTQNINSSVNNAMGSAQWYFIYGRFDSGARKFGWSTLGSGSNGAGTGSGTLSNYGTDVCQIGSIRNTAGSYFNGRIDDVRIYNRALSDTEIQNNQATAY